MSQVEVSSTQPDQVSDSSVKGSEFDFKSTVHKVKVDGNEMEIPYEELLSGYQLSRSSKMRFDEAAKMRKSVEEFSSRLKDGDFSILEDYVPKDKLRSWAEKELTEYIQWEELPEYEKKRLIAESERDQYKRDLEEYERKQQEQHMSAVEEQAAVEIDNEIADAINKLKKTTGKDVPITQELVQDIARLMLSQLQEGHERVSADIAAEKILGRYKKKFGSYVSSLSASDLRSILTTDQLNALRKEELEKAMSKMPNNIRHLQSDDKPRKKREKLTTEQYFEMMDKKFKG